MTNATSSDRALRTNFFKISILKHESIVRIQGQGSRSFFYQANKFAEVRLLVGAYIPENQDYAFT